MLDSKAIQAHLDGLTKPPGSLGELERLAGDLCRIQATLQPRTRPRRLVVFAGDHGVVESGVSAWPSEVTAAMVANIASGGAASSVFARTYDAQLRLVDVGCRGPRHAETEALRVARVAPGTADLSRGPAMSVDQLHAALDVGRTEARDAAHAGVRVVIGGEMGIGNSTAASCLSALLSDLPVAEAVGRGAGADDETLRRKQEIVARAVERELPHIAERPEAAIAALAGFEIAAMAGFFLEAHQQGLTILLDGQIATSAALVAHRFDAGVARSMIAAHRSVEPAHIHVLRHLQLEPFLDWNLRLGEGTGALLLLPLLDAAAGMVGEMAHLADLMSTPPN